MGLSRKSARRCWSWRSDASGSNVTRVLVLNEEAKLAAERKRYDLGASTAYQVIQFQDDLASARMQQVSAVIDYNRAMIAFEAGPRDVAAKVRGGDCGLLCGKWGHKGLLSAGKQMSANSMDQNLIAARILIADDQPQILTALCILLKPEGYQIETAASAEGILEALAARDFDAVLMDLNYSRGSTTGEEGLDLLARVQQIDGTLPVIVMTAWSSVELAVEAMRRGARDFVAKPWKNERLLAILRAQIELSRALRQTRRLEEENRILREGMHSKLIAQSRAMRPVLGLIERAGPSGANILITGENGTGKSVVASLLHELFRTRIQATDHPRRGKPRRQPVRERAVRPRARRIHRR